MAHYRKKPVVIEAVQWTSCDASWNSIEELQRLSGARWDTIQRVSDGTLAIATKEGVMRAVAGDWIIKGVAGEFYPCKPEIFAATYEEVAA